MLRRSAWVLDKTKAPTKVYKYGYQPDPRKFAPMERVRTEELFPRVVRPPCAATPDVDTFLDKCDIHETVPLSDFKATFAGWDELMLSRVGENKKVRGLSPKQAQWLAECLDDYRNGRPPGYFDKKAENTYFRQFSVSKTSGGKKFRVPELPEKYRPHQTGEDSRPLRNYQELNRMPDWAIKEEERLAASGKLASAKK